MDEVLPLVNLRIKRSRHVIVRANSDRTSRIAAAFPAPTPEGRSASRNRSQGDDRAGGEYACTLGVALVDRGTWAARDLPGARPGNSEPGYSDG